jgi:hypothetical protein
MLNIRIGLCGHWIAPVCAIPTAATGDTADQGKGQKPLLFRAF